MGDCRNRGYLQLAWVVPFDVVPQNPASLPFVHLFSYLRRKMFYGIQLQSRLVQAPVDCGLYFRQRPIATHSRWAAKPLPVCQQGCCLVLQSQTLGGHLRLVRCLVAAFPVVPW